MTTLLLVRHGRTTANGAGVLAGWTEGVSLDDAGHEQVTALAQRLAPVPLAAVVTSPLQRCLETTDLMLAGRDDVARHVDDRVGEVRYGDWSGEKLSKLAKDPLWKVVQAHPSAMTFPGEGGEAMRDMQVRAVAAVREWNHRLGDDAVYAVVSHGDVIKAVLADALGMHLDQFQRLVADPASVSIVTYTALRPFVVRMNDGGGDLSFLAPKPKRKSRRKAGSAAGSSRSSSRSSAGSSSAGSSSAGSSSDAAVGGGAGPQA